MYVTTCNTYVPQRFYMVNLYLTKIHNPLVFAVGIRFNLVFYDFY